MRVGSKGMLKGGCYDDDSGTTPPRPFLSPRRANAGPQAIIPQSIMLQQPPHRCNHFTVQCTQPYHHQLGVDNSSANAKCHRPCLEILHQPPPQSQSDAMHWKFKNVLLNDLFVSEWKNDIWHKSIHLSFHAPIYKVYALQMFPSSASCKYCMDTWADTRIWNWTGLGEARMPASSFGFFIQGSFLLRPQPLVYDDRKDK